jgi:DNA primase
VVFTFDGDAAGRRAAQRAFAEDQSFAARTFVAIAPDGLDPCDLRLARGDAAVRALIDAKVPLIEFVIRSSVAGFNVDTVEGRLAALHAAAPIVARVSDPTRRHEYARRLAGWLGMEQEPVVQAVADVIRTGASSDPARARPAPAEKGAPVALPTDRDPRTAVEREVLKVALQLPALATGFDELPLQAFTVPWYRALGAAILRAGGVRAVRSGQIPSGAAWVDRVRAHVTAADPSAAPTVQTGTSSGREADPSPPMSAQIQSPTELAHLVDALSVEPLRAAGEPDARYVAAQLSRLTELHLARRELELRSRLQRLDPTADPDGYAATFRELVELERVRRTVSEASA